jgi:hypothetical protein
MANLQDLKGIIPATRLFEAHVDEPRFLLDELVERKLSTLLAGETDPGDGSRHTVSGTLRI